MSYSFIKMGCMQIAIEKFQKVMHILYIQNFNMLFSTEKSKVNFIS